MVPKGGGGSALLSGGCFYINPTLELWDFNLILAFAFNEQFWGAGDQEGFFD